MTIIWGLPGGSFGKESSYGAGDPGLISGWGSLSEEGMAIVSSILAGEFHGQRSLVGCSSWGLKELDMIEWLTLSLFIFNTVIFRWLQLYVCEVYTVSDIKAFSLDSFCGARVWGENDDEILNLVWDFSGEEFCFLFFFFFTESVKKLLG